MGYQDEVHYRFHDVISRGECRHLVHVQDGRNGEKHLGRDVSEQVGERDQQGHTEPPADEIDQLEGAQVTIFAQGEPSREQLVVGRSVQDLFADVTYETRSHPASGQVQCFGHIGVNEGPVKGQVHPIPPGVNFVRVIRQGNLPRIDQILFNNNFCLHL